MPFLKWVGGKGRLITQLSKHFPDSYGSYFEPFLGGGAVFFSLQAETAVINDINKKLMNTYINVRDNVDRLIEELSEIEIKYRSLELEERKLMYYELRSEYNLILDNTTIRKSALLIFLNKTCFNGMYRENKKGGYNVPFGKYPNPKICDKETLYETSKMLQKTSILCGSYKDAVATAKKGDFIYFDPPYHPISHTSSFTSYSGDGFTENDQIDLKNLFDELNSRGCKIMLSNSYTKFIQGLYDGYNKHKVYAGRSINSNGKNRGKIAEILVTNY